ncbi:MAG: alanine/glycine:cation symporter family protein [Saprospiraceae bacterium]
MKRSLHLLLLTLFLPFASFAQDAQEAVGLDEMINNWFRDATAPIVATVFYSIPVSDAVSIPIVLIILILGALYFTFYFGFVNFTKFGMALRVVRGDYDHLDKDTSTGTKTLGKNDPKVLDSSIRISESSVSNVDGDNPDTIRVEGAHGEVSHFQALTAALSATVGLGNIAGVAVALSIGGAGATFWMILAGLIGMSSKFVECTLGVRYREVGPDGTIYGGPMYYLSKGLGERGMAGFGKFCAVFFAIMCIGGSFGGGNMFQANQAFQMFQYVTGGEESFIYGSGWVFGLVMAIGVGIVIIGGIKSIAKVTDKIVPVMVAIYVFASIAVLVLNASAIPGAFGEIFNGAFTATGITGGFIGVLIQGFKRAAFSNEAGIGSASIAHSAVITKYPASEGLVALLEPFIDTVVVCTMTALVIIITGNLEIGAQLSFEDGVLLTNTSFESALGSWFPYVLTLAVVLFAFSTMISWSYYGYQAWSYLFGRSKTLEYVYKIIFCLFVIVGSAASLGAVIDFSDAMIFAMLFPNMIGLFFLAPKVKEELNRYLTAIKNSPAK